VNLDPRARNADTGHMTSEVVPAASWINDIRTIWFCGDDVLVYIGDDGCRHGPVEAGRILATVFLPAGSEN